MLHAVPLVPCSRRLPVGLAISSPPSGRVSGPAAMTWAVNSLRHSSGKVTGPEPYGDGSSAWRVDIGSISGARRGTRSRTPGSSLSIFSLRVCARPRTTIGFGRTASTAGAVAGRLVLCGRRAEGRGSYSAASVGAAGAAVAASSMARLASRSASEFALRGMCSNVTWSSCASSRRDSACNGWRPGCRTL